jgi:hypothetical protein
VKAPIMRSAGPFAPRFVAGFDSASAMVRMLSRYLKGKDSPGLAGLAPPSETVSSLTNALPPRGRELLYILSGWGEAVPESKAGEIRAEELSRWVVNSYPERPYQAAMVGSSSGAMIHLAAALGIPWLPQTQFVPIRRGKIHPDEPMEDMEFGKRVAPEILEKNPDLQLHHMHDPNQDRLMIHLMTYFRFKQLRLGTPYEEFLKKNLEPGAPIYVVDCRRRWATTKLGERHYFQFGALGGATPDEFLHGSDRVAEYLERYDSHRRKWEPPQPDGEMPEAEWGLDHAFLEDTRRFAEENGFEVRQMIFDEPEHPSPFVADLYRWWYRQRGYKPNRLFVESFITMEPYWALRTGSAPFWLKFMMEPSADWLERYLDETEPYDEIYMTLFSSGVEAVGLPPIERWEAILKRAQREGRFVGTDPSKYPRDFGVYGRLTQDMQSIPARYPMPGPMALSVLQRFIEESGERYPVRWDWPGLRTAATPEPSADGSRHDGFDRSARPDHARVEGS